MTKLEKYLPYIIALILPGVSVLANIPENNSSHIIAIAGVWLIISFFLLILWKLIEYILNISNKSSRFLSLFPGVLIIISIFLISFHYLLSNYIDLPEQFPIWLSAARLCFVAVLDITIIQSFRSAKEREILRIENISLQSEYVKAQFYQLQQQFNPHFLFNSLSTLRSMVHSVHPESEEYILRLSDLYHQVLQKRESQVVTLREELDFLENYTYLMKLRYENAIFFEMEILQDSLNYTLPVFSLQLLVENCVKHNIVSENKPLTIRIFQKDIKSITILNNFQPKKVSVSSSGFGIENLKSRYSLLNCKPGVSIEQNKESYSTTIDLF